MITITPDMLTIGQLVELLGEYPSDTLVLATWETVVAPVKAAEFTFVASCPSIGGAPVLVIDVEDYVGDVEDTLRRTPCDW